MQKQDKQTPERFFKLLEAGDLAFLDFMEYAIVIFGITKHGKTTYSHHLTGHALEAYMNTDNAVHYRLVRETDKKSDARIGATMQSQTEIPNKFETNLFEGQKPIYLIDNPGQLDSFGINRVLSNAYFHYRIFSKIQNMKFILLFDYPMFSGDIKATNQILNIFFKSFSNFNKVKNQLLKSIAFVFTKVETNISLKDVHERMKHYIKCIKEKNHFEDDKLQFIEKLMELSIKTQNRIKIFRKAQIGVPVETNPSLLNEIHSSIEYFSRDVALADEFESKFYQQKKTVMKNIKFSETNKVMALSRQEKQKIRTENLFKELSLRGKSMFQLFFETITQLFVYVLFDSETNELNTKNKLNETEIIRQKRRQAQKSIIENFNKLEIKYDSSEKYQIRREQILKRYADCFKNTQKVDNFIQRLVSISQVYNICLIYINIDLFQKKNESTINRTRKDFQNIFEKLSRFYSGKQEIEILSKFMYNLNTILNQIIVFCMIVLPHAEENEENSSNPNKIIQVVDPHLEKFLDFLLLFSRYASNMDKAIIDQLQKEFNITQSSAVGLQTNSTMYHYLKKFPNVIIDQKDREEKVLKSLKTVQLTMEHKIHCEILIFRCLRKKYYYLKQLKSFEEKKSQIIQESLEKDTKCLIKSLIVYLKSVKKMKQLSQFKEFAAYRPQIYEINFSVWTYVVKLFSQLLDIEEIPKIEKDLYQQILIEIVSTSRNYSLIEEVFEKLLRKYQESFEEISIKSSARKVVHGSQKKLKVFSPDSFKYFLDLKSKLSAEIINLALSYADLLFNLGLKDKSLAQCYSVMKYAEFSPQLVVSIEDMIKKIKSKSIGFRIEQELKSVSEFEATITLKKQLGKFLKDNQQIEQLECVNYEFLN